MKGRARATRRNWRWLAGGCGLVILLLSGRWLWQAGSSGYLIGALFLRSVERAERVQHAMLARGFDGVNLTGEAAPATQWRFADSIALAVVGALVVTVSVTSHGLING